MRHRKSGKKLGRTWEHRKAMFRNMARSLITYGRIKTTVPKAKELSKIVDKLVTLAKRNDLSSRRQAYKVLENHSLVQKLFDEIGPQFSQCKGGYTRVVKFATPRVGDSAAMAMIEFKYYAEPDVSEASEASPTKPAASAAAGGASTAAALDTEKSDTPEDLKEPEQAVSKEEISDETSVQSPEEVETKADDSDDSTEPSKDEPSEPDKDK